MNQTFIRLNLEAARANRFTIAYFTVEGLHFPSVGTVVSVLGGTTTLGSFSPGGRVEISTMREMILELPIRAVDWDIYAKNVTVELEPYRNLIEQVEEVARLLREHGWSLSLWQNTPEDAL